MKTMRTAILFTFFLALPIISSAQTLEGEFEEWSGGSGSERPVGWYCGPIGFGKDSTTPYSGRYAASVWTWYGEALGYMMTSKRENFLWDLKDAGIPINFTPTKLTGHYKYDLGQTLFREGHGEDSAAVYILLKRYNEELGDIDTISFVASFLPAAAEWTSFSIDIPFTRSELQADSIVVAFYSSNPDKPAFCGPESSTCCYLSVDDLALTTTSGVSYNIDPFLSPARVVPNPVVNAGATLRFNGQPGKTYRMSIHDASGRTAAEREVTGGEADISSLRLPAGAYYFTIVDDAGKPVAADRFIVQ